MKKLNNSRIKSPEMARVETLGKIILGKRTFVLFLMQLSIYFFEMSPELSLMIL